MKSGLFQKQLEELLTSKVGANRKKVDNLFLNIVPIFTYKKRNIYRLLSIFG
jgi:hypothetical protein